MVESPRYKDLLQLFNDWQDEYLVVGGYAVMKYWEPLPPFLESRQTSYLLMI